MSSGPAVAAAAPRGGGGVGGVGRAGGLQLAFGASLSLRSIWGKPVPPEKELPRTGPLNPRAKPLQSPALGNVRTRVRLLLSFDFGCLALVAAFLILTGMVIVFRGLGA